MRLEARLRKLEQKNSPSSFGREVWFRGRSQEEAEREARAMIGRGEIAADDLVLRDAKAPFGPPWIRELPCTIADYRAWLETLT
jgi:hypothetical protein